MSDLQSLKFERDAWGRLLLTSSDRQTTVGIEPVRCFPLSDPQKMIALLDSEGHELITIPDLTMLNASAREFLEAELASRDFIPTIERVISTSSPNPPCQWRVLTDRGETTFQLESEDDVRKLGPHRVMIADSNGIRYTISDVRTLDSVTQRIVQRLA